MTLEVVLCQRLGEYVSNLVFGIDREYLDKSLAHMFAKMMITNIDVLSPRTEFGKPCEFKSTGIVFKYLAVYIWLRANDLEISLPHFL